MQVCVVYESLSGRCPRDRGFRIIAAPEGFTVAAVTRVHRL